MHRKRRWMAFVVFYSHLNCTENYGKHEDIWYVVFVMLDEQRWYVDLSCINTNVNCWAFRLFSKDASDANVLKQSTNITKTLPNWINVRVWLFTVCFCVRGVDFINWSILITTAEWETCILVRLGSIGA